MITFAAFYIAMCIILYITRDKTVWVYEGDERHDAANPPRKQVWDDSCADDWTSGMWVDA